MVALQFHQASLKVLAPEQFAAGGFGWRLVQEGLLQPAVEQGVLDVSGRGASTVPVHMLTAFAEMLHR